MNSAKRAEIKYMNLKDLKNPAWGFEKAHRRVNLRGTVSSVLRTKNEVNITISSKLANDNKPECFAVVRYLLKKSGSNMPRFNYSKRLRAGDVIGAYGCKVRSPVTTHYKPEVTASNYVLICQSVQQTTLLRGKSPFHGIGGKENLVN